MWVDLRVARSDTGAALDLLMRLRTAADPVEVGEVRIDPDPPAAEPEVELSIRVPAGVAGRVRSQLGDMVVAERLRTWDR